MPLNEAIARVLFILGYRDPEIFQKLGFALKNKED